MWEARTRNEALSRKERERGGREREKERERERESHRHLPWPRRKKEESTSGFSADREGEIYLYGENTGKSIKGVGRHMGVGILNKDEYDNLRIGGRLRKPDLMLSQASEKKLPMTGMVWLPLKVGGVRRKHKLYVAFKLYHQVILGEDWLSGWKNELKFDSPPPHWRSEE